MQQKLLINKNHPSNSFDERSSQEIKFLILHFTAQDCQTSLRLLQDQVSVHYLVSSQPAEVFQLVDEDKKAWHCGESFWAEMVGLNNSSIGIEIVNLDGNINFYPSEQIEAVMELCKQIIARHKISPECVLGHSDIAPLRKDDPGSLFPWRLLYKNGIGAMVDDCDVEKLVATISIPNALELQQSLAKYGYKIDLTGVFDEQTTMVFNAFRRHFCPELIGLGVDLKSYATLLALIGKYKRGDVYDKKL
jgi:N-acetylmuramoyl-L-alanine amidase